ncbi:toprim domain-containing protein [Apilactobacillus timberlakei]|uniref:toprim domain-containing protein n=1 Tax=Apilactobacillus timberlakei TaxID=2008380 RepID=UPI001126BFFC|nr:toprim domain-containing protein [Apilactobacillus timberlakei]TPR16724.1 hypothetical protein DYZ95_07020 [Apilactobacillus timberlakei]TPR21586.1 hypothetical protein DY083_06070 [Apilactobacillus timberlakei]
MANNAPKNYEKTLKEFRLSLEQGKSSVYDNSFTNNKSFISKEKDLTDDERLKLNNHEFAKEPFVDQFKRHNSKNDKDFIKSYLVGKRKLNSSIVDTMINQGLVRGVNTPKYKFIEFVWKMPVNEKQSNEFNIQEQETVGIDRMSFFENEKGEIQRKSREEGGQTIGKNSKSSYGFNIKSGTGKDNLFVFEAPVDALSYASMYGSEIAGTNTTLLSISGVSKSDSIQNYMSKQYAKNSDYKNVILCVDKDHAGRKMIGDFTKEVKDKEQFVKNASNYRHHVYIKEANIGKDWNDTAKSLDHFLNNSNDNDNDIEKKLKQNNRYDLDEYIFQRAKVSIYGATLKNTIVNHVDALSSMYDSFKQNHAMNLYSKNYSQYKKTLDTLEKQEKPFMEFLEEFGSHMNPNELKKYVHKAVKNHEMTPSERRNINNIKKLREKDPLLANDMITDQVINNKVSLEGLDKYQTLMKGYKTDDSFSIEQDKDTKIEQDKSKKYSVENIDLKGSKLLYKSKNSYIEVSLSKLEQDMNDNLGNQNQYVIKYPDGIIRPDNTAQNVFSNLKTRKIEEMYRDDREEILNKSYWQPEQSKNIEKEVVGNNIEKTTNLELSDEIFDAKNSIDNSHKKDFDSRINDDNGVRFNNNGYEKINTNSKLYENTKENKNFEKQQNNTKNHKNFRKKKINKSRMLAYENENGDISQLTADSLRKSNGKNKSNNYEDSNVNQQQSISKRRVISRR